MQELTPHDVARLRAESMCDVRSIKRWWAGEAVRDATAARLEKAAKTLRIKRPRRSK
jgi:hypothetical protein